MIWRDKCKITLYKHAGSGSTTTIGSFESQCFHGNNKIKFSNNKYYNIRNADFIEIIFHEQNSNQICVCEKPWVFGCQCGGFEAEMKNKYGPRQ